MVIWRRGHTGSRVGLARNTLSSRNIGPWTHAQTNHGPTDRLLIPCCFQVWLKLKDGDGQKLRAQTMELSTIGKMAMQHGGDGGSLTGMRHCCLKSGKSTSGLE